MISGLSDLMPAVITEVGGHIVYEKSLGKPLGIGDYDVKMSKMDSPLLSYTTIPS